ncbi:hypothetical protein ACFRCG_39945 [Embleya sp. NPDC056575]|uniref:hypothetical protein n=1 Tax=unclassified Embleya TaxID=2699296 RepID=UPI0036C154F7
MAGPVRPGAGGIAGLAHLLREHGEAIEADLLRYYQVDLLDLYRGEMSWRRLRVLIRYLPVESATSRAMQPRDPKDEFWADPMDRRMAAWLVNAVRENTYATILLNGDPKKVKRIRPPKPIGPEAEADTGRSGVIRFGGRHGSGAKELAAVFGGPAGG